MKRRFFYFFLFFAVTLIGGFGRAEKAVSLSIPTEKIDYGCYAGDLPYAVQCEPGQPEVIDLGSPAFTAAELTAAPYESYVPLDDLGRCGAAAAMLDKSLMPSGDRESIGDIKPSGWHTVRYDDLISDRYLYNRCHLIAFCLAGENANERNLITGTRAMNLAMLPYETKIAEYIEAGGRVAYRVTPRFIGAELVARGVELEAQSIDDPAAISLHVFLPNVQPGIAIDYLTGDSRSIN